MKTLRKARLRAVPNNSSLRTRQYLVEFQEGEDGTTDGGPGGDRSAESFMADLLIRLTPRGSTLCLFPGGDLLNWALKKLESGEKFVHSSNLAAMMVSPRKETIQDALVQAPDHSRNTLLFAAMRCLPDRIPHGFYRNLEVFGDPTAATLTFWQAQRVEKMTAIRLSSTSVAANSLMSALESLASEYGIEAESEGFGFAPRILQHTGDAR